MFTGGICSHTHAVVSPLSPEQVVYLCSPSPEIPMRLSHLQPKSISFCHCLRFGSCTFVGLLFYSVATYSVHGYVRHVFFGPLHRLPLVYDCASSLILFVRTEFVQSLHSHIASNEIVLRCVCIFVLLFSAVNTNYFLCVFYLHNLLSARAHKRFTASQFTICRKKQYAFTRANERDGAQRVHSYYTMQ